MGLEEFWFNEAYFLTQPNENNFLELIKNEVVVVEIRMHIRDNAVARNHGTAFRIQENFLNLCFGGKEQLI